MSSTAKTSRSSTSTSLLYHSTRIRCRTSSQPGLTREEREASKGPGESKEIFWTWRMQQERGKITILWTSLELEIYWTPTGIFIIRPKSVLTENWVKLWWGCWVAGLSISTEIDWDHHLPMYLKWSLISGRTSRRGTSWPGSTRYLRPTRGGRSMCWGNRLWIR